MSNNRIQLSDKSIQNGWRLAAETERGQLFWFRPLNRHPVDSSMYVRYTRNNAVAEVVCREGKSGKVIGRTQSNTRDKRGKAETVLAAANS